MAALLHDFGVPVQERVDSDGVAKLMAALREQPEAEGARSKQPLVKVPHSRCAEVVFENWRLPPIHRAGREASRRSLAGAGPREGTDDTGAPGRADRDGGRVHLSDGTAPVPRGPRTLLRAMGLPEDALPPVVEGLPSACCWWPTPRPESAERAAQPSQRRRPAAVPAAMPSIRSCSRVSSSVTTSTSRSPRECAQHGGDRRTFDHVPGHRHQHAGERGQRHIGHQRRATSMNSSSRTACSMPATGRARAGADVGGGAGDGAGDAQCRRTAREPILATPWAISSLLERCCRPVMPSATTADSRLSMAPSSAKLTAPAATAASIRCQRDIRQRGRRQAMRNAAEAAADGFDGQPADSAASKAAAVTAISRPGTRGACRRSSTDGRHGAERDGQRVRIERAAGLPQRCELRQEGRRLGAADAGRTDRAAGSRR